MPAPLAYFITFTCYGTWLHGDSRGSADRIGHNNYGDPYLPADPGLNRFERFELKHPAYRLDTTSRATVLCVIQEVCRYRGWVLHAVHVRPTHVHMVVSGDAVPERMMYDFKAYASRRLNESGQDPAGCVRWTRHGSTRYLWRESDVAEVIDYVVNRQGAPLAVYRANDPR